MCANNYASAEDHVMWNKDLEAERQIAYKVADVLSSPIELLHQEEQARILFNSCKSWEDTAGTPSASLRRMIGEMCRMTEELRSWPVLDDADGTLSDFNDLVKAVSRHYESWPFFSISADIDQHQNNNTLLFIDNPKPFFRDLVGENSTLYEQVLSLYAKLWAQVTGKSLDDATLAKEAAEVARFEKDIAEIVRPMAETFANPLSMNIKFKVSQLSELLPLVDWNDVLLSFTPAYLHDYVCGDPEVIVANPEYFRQLDRILAKYKTRTQFNYAWWHEIIVKLIVRTETSGGSLTESCVDFTSHALPEALDSVFLNRVQMLADSDYSVVDALFGDVQAAMLAVLDEVNWLDERSREQARQKARFQQLKIIEDDVF